MKRIPIHFFSEDISFTLKNKTTLRSWLNAIIVSESRLLHELTFIFCSDIYLLDINLRYLAHDTLTDVITFDNSDDSSSITGDIFISIERVKENAKHFTAPFEHELHRVMAHGVLHLLGYKDKTKKQMEEIRRKEDFYLTQR